jgi:hypothetical protein
MVADLGEGLARWATGHDVDADGSIQHPPTDGALPKVSLNGLHWSEIGSVRSNGIRVDIGNCYRFPTSLSKPLGHSSSAAEQVREPHFANLRC